MDLDLVILLATLLFFAALHQWPVDGRRWERAPVKKEADGEPAPRLADD